MKTTGVASRAQRKETTITLGGGGQGWPGVAAPQDRGAALSGAGKEPPASPQAPLPRCAETCAGAMGF
jgi:hypothetical protein